jgi:uncharacterized protein (DUF1499 family)
MNTTAQVGARWPGNVTRAAYFVGIVAIVLLVIAGPAYRLGLLALVPALLGAAIGFLLCIVTFIVGAIGLLAGGRHEMARSRAAVAVIIVSMLVTVVAGFWISRGLGTAPIHDVTTDLNDPPVFKDVLPLRAASGAMNPPEYQRIQSMQGHTIDVPGAQRRAYSDLQPVALPQPPGRAVEMAEQVAKDMGWSIVAVAPSEGRLEATDTTLYFGFKDDIVVRATPKATGSKVDVRSESRVGGGDAGTNAKRVRAFLAKLRKSAGE